MLRILAIGNSFSEDATYYLHDILENSHVENEVINLYIGGCPLERHFLNMEGDKKEYQYQINGRKTDRYVSVREVLEEGCFDAVVLHQASHDSGWENTYEPFMGLILCYLKKYTEAKIFLNETWAYESDSSHSGFMRYHRDQSEMFERLERAYKTISLKYELPLIPSGEMIQKIRRLPDFSEKKLCITRDGFHMSYLYGRYAVAMMWAKYIGEIDAGRSTFVPEVNFLPDGRSEPSIVNAIRELIDKEG